MSAPNGSLITFGPTPSAGVVTVLSDTDLYIIEPSKVKTARSWLTVKQPLITGGERLAYRVLQSVSYSFDIMFLGNVLGYNAAIHSYWALCGKPSPDGTSQFEKAALYWTTFNNDPDPNPPFFFQESFFDQNPPTQWLVTSCEHDEPIRDVIQAASIHVSVKLGLTPIPTGLALP